MSLLLFLIPMILGLIVTAVINRVMAVFYLLAFLGFGIFILIYYLISNKDTLAPLVDVISYLIIIVFGIFALPLFLYIVYVAISLYIEQYKSNLKRNKQKNDDK